MAGPGVSLEIDASDLMAETERLRAVMKPEQFERAMYRVFSRTGGHVRRILRTDLPKQYHVTSGDVGAAVKNAKITHGGGGVGCAIPVVGEKRNIGSKFKASGGAHGWNSLRRKYRVNAKIVKAGTSTLPSQMSSYGGQPPFRNLGSRLMPLTFTRAGKARLPIMKVSGIAIPQMPTNRSEADVQNDIKEYMYQRMEHEFMRIIGGH